MFISHAQNFEDVMLWRALQHVQQGFYIDIGAQDPVVDSVSQAFHERGWRGIHVEPTVHYADLLRQQRPGDIVIQAAVGGDSSVLPLFEIPGSGISTLDSDIAAQHRERGFNVRETTTPLVPLSSVLALAETNDVHWMKIDVEGYERQVLASWGDCQVLPWLVVVESTLPLTQIQSHEHWECLLLDKGYTFAYFDGLNRFYVSDRQAQLKQAFEAPPNVFDQFALSGTASATLHLFIQQKYEAQLHGLRQRLEEQAAAAQAEQLAVRSAAQTDQEGWVHTRQTLERTISDIQTELASAERSLEAATQQLSLHTEREQSLHQQLEVVRNEFTSAQRVAGQQIAALSEQLTRAIDALQAQTHVSAEAHAIAQRLVETYKSQLAEQAQMQVQRELGMTQQFDVHLNDLRKGLEAQASEAQIKLRTVEQIHSAAQQALQTEISEQQTRLQALQAAVDNYAAERSLLEASFIGRLSLRLVRRKRFALNTDGSLPIDPPR
jgi:FkbM family methyltransferase